MVAIALRVETIASRLGWIIFVFYLAKELLKALR